MTKKIINGNTYYFHLSMMEVIALEQTIHLSETIDDAIKRNSAKDMIAIMHILITKSICQIINGRIAKSNEYALKFGTSKDMQDLIKEIATCANMSAFFEEILDTTHMCDIIKEASKESTKTNERPKDKIKKAPFSFKYYDNYALMFEEDEKDTIYFAYADNNDKNVSGAWKSKKDANMTVTEVYYHDNYPLNIIEGYISKDKLNAFTAYMKELNEALSYMYDETTYEESKMFIKAQVYAGYYDRLRDEGYIDGK